MKYGYARCSTNESKQDINRQTRELKNLGIKEDNIFFEYESGTKDVRNRIISIDDTRKSNQAKEEICNNFMMSLRKKKYFLMKNCRW